MNWMDWLREANEKGLTPEASSLEAGSNGTPFTCIYPFVVGEVYNEGAKYATHVLVQSVAHMKSFPFENSYRIIFFRRATSINLSLGLEDVVWLEDNPYSPHKQAHTRNPLISPSLPLSLSLSLSLSL